MKKTINQLRRALLKTSRQPQKSTHRTARRAVHPERQKMQKIKELCPRFESKQDALDRSDGYCRALGKSAKGARRLRRRLLKCQRGQPCGLPFCPVCVRRLRLKIIPEMVDCIERILGGCR
jgi:hypothetical protein